MMANLPHDLLVSIAQRLVSLEDFIHFGAVCKSWNSAAIKEYFRRTHQVPWLMIPENKSTGIRQFYDLKKDKIFNLDLPETIETMCCSSLGWLMTQSFQNSEVNLMHPLNHQQHSYCRKILPNLTTFINYHTCPDLLKLLGGGCLIQKFVLSSSPSFTSDFIVLILSGERLAFWRPGDQDWTLLDAQDRRDRSISLCYSDITYYKEQFYVVDNACTVSVCEFGHPEQANTRVVVPRMPSEVMGNPYLCYNVYLVEAAGALLLILRSKATNKFRVYQVPLSDGRWSSDLEVTNLGNITLFLGYNSTFSIDASEHPGCKSNCIYFTNRPRYLNTTSPGNCTGIYHMKDGNIQVIQRFTHEHQTPFLWIEPSF